MKQVVLKSVFAITIAIIFSSCFALHGGNMSDSAALSSGNFSYVKYNMKGEATATYFLGIGGLAKNALVAEAKQQMLSSNSLGSNQALVNVTVNYKYSFFFLMIVRTVTCTVTADVVEFEPTNH